MRSWPSRGFASNEPIALSVRDLSVHFGTRQVLHDLTFDIPNRAITALVGNSGSGKSTLLRALSRLLALQVDARVCGHALLGGIDLLAEAVPAADVRRRLAMIFPMPGTLPGSVRWNFQFALRLHGRFSRRAVEQAMIEALSRVGLWPRLLDALDRPATRLSLGDQQRLCIARALALGAEALLMDEPTSMLDWSTALSIEELLETLKAEMAIVLATSQLTQAARCADLVVRMHAGAISKVGSAAEVLLHNVA